MRHDFYSMMHYGDDVQKMNGNSYLSLFLFIDVTWHARDWE